MALCNQGKDSRPYFVIWTKFYFAFSSVFLRSITYSSNININRLASFLGTVLIVVDTVLNELYTIPLLVDLRIYRGTSKEHTG